MLFFSPARVLKTKKKQAINTIQLRQTERKITMIVSPTRKIDNICSNMYFQSSTSFFIFSHFRK